MAETNRQFLIAELPKGKLGPEHFRLTEAPLVAPADGQVLVRARDFALDAAMRAWMLGPTYRAALTAGQMMAGTAMAEVVESRAPGFAVGDLVFGETGWQEYATLPAQQLTKLPNIQPLTYLLNVYGTAGLTAYFGLLEVGEAQDGDTVVVSARSRRGAARLPVRSRRSRAAASSVSPAARPSVTCRLQSSASMPPSTTRRVWSIPPCRRPRTAASMSTSTTWAARFSKACCST